MSCGAGCVGVRVCAACMRGCVRPVGDRHGAAARCPADAVDFEQRGAR